MLARSFLKMSAMGAQRSMITKMGSLGLGFYTAKNFAFGADSLMRRAQLAACEENMQRTEEKISSRDLDDLISLDYGNIILKNRTLHIVLSFINYGGCNNMIQSYFIDDRFT